MKTYTPTIGLEIHAELKTSTKMFCASKNAPHEGEPNTHVCPICMGHPGTLPVINKTAVAHVLKVGTALGGTLATFTEFDRKNYFYPDIPKGYQISQYEFPLVKGGMLAGVQITRIHLEEDTARSLHDQTSGSVVDYNRAGVPLMELVTEPVIHDAKVAGNFARELQLLLRTLGVSDANMEKGEMRVEANISVSDSVTFGTKVEVKNLNSFRSVEQAIAYEIKRHIEVLENGDKIIQETRGWDEVKLKTFSQRKKETANDYRYFPDPDLPKLFIEVANFNLALPELPSEKREKYNDLGITREQTEIIIANKTIAEFFDLTLSHLGDSVSVTARLAANYFVTDVLSSLKADALKAGAAMSFSKLIKMLSDKKITSRVAKDIVLEVISTAVDPEILVKERGLSQRDAEIDLLPLIQKIVSDNVAVAEEYRAGKEAALQFLVGQGMKATKGTVNPTVLADLLKSNIRESL